MNIFKNTGRRFATLLLTLLLVLPLGAFAQEVDYGSAKNVIVMVPNGMNVELATYARSFTDYFELALDSMNTGLVRTNNAKTPIANSAPAGTAMATGYKSQSPYITSYPSEAGMPGAEDFDATRANYPIATVLEGPKSKGMATGIVSTSNVNHATPADFSAHQPNRNEYQRIIEQQVYQGMDVVLGAGSGYLDPEQRDDGQDLIQEVKDLGYDYVSNKDQLKASKSDKIWGMFAEWSMAYDLDRPAEEPSLAEMTQKALEVLSKVDQGFFLLVEGSEIDWACHDYDTVAAVYDTLAFDKAVKLAKDFADKN